jgi:hypothetical protein
MTVHQLYSTLIATCTYRTHPLNGNALHSVQRPWREQPAPEVLTHGNAPITTVYREGVVQDVVGSDWASLRQTSAECPRTQVRTSTSCKEQRTNGHSGGAITTLTAHDMTWKLFVTVGHTTLVKSILSSTSTIQPRRPVLGTLNHSMKL